jgi:23S rRNA (cytosine1962-C5)-methyltransferase
MLPTVKLKPGREKPLLRRHPWIFSGAIGRVDEDIANGQTVEVVDSNGNFLAKGAFSPQSQIRVRVWSWDSEVPVKEGFFRGRLSNAFTARQDILDTRDTDAYRLVHGESDGLPGLIVDRYGDCLVVQSLSSGSEYWLETIVDLLVALTGDKRIYERSDADVRELEGLPQRAGRLYPSKSGLWQTGESDSAIVEIIENGIRFRVDVLRGHKTGFYLDQRDNRARVGRLAQNREVLDCFSYTGGFTLACLAGGAAEVTAVDSSADALALAHENLELNGYNLHQLSMIQGDVFQVLRSFRDQARSFDLIILDPPKFAPTAAQAQQAARGYKDINLLAFKLLRPGGLLATFSCSGGISADLFQKIVAGAALDAAVEAQIIERLSQGPDHPVSLHFPEGAYLKGLICRV